MKAEDVILEVHSQALQGLLLKVLPSMTFLFVTEASVFWIRACACDSIAISIQSVKRKKLLRKLLRHLLRDEWRFPTERRAFVFAIERTTQVLQNRRVFLLVLCTNRETSGKRAARSAKQNPFWASGGFPAIHIIYIVK